MKKYVLLLTILVAIAGWSGNGFCQEPVPGCPSNNLQIQKPIVAIYNTKNHPELGNGTYLMIGFTIWNPPTALMYGLERVTAQNITNSQFDDHVYEFDLTPVLRNFTGEFDSVDRFKGQYGMYELKIERSNLVSPPAPYLPNPFKCYTDPIEDGLIPLPVPKNLKVSFKSGAATPTLSFDPVGGFLSASDEWYEIRIYDKDYTRRIYRVTIGCTSCSKPDSTTSVTFPEYRAISGQTYEDLVPGEEYLFRADLTKLLPGGNTIQATNFKLFKVPKK